MLSLAGLCKDRLHDSCRRRNKSLPFTENGWKGGGRRMERVIAYVDGFNLYFGMKEKGWERYLWLNVEALVLNLLKPGQRLVLTKYFTSRVSGTVRDPGKPRRQNAYLEALQTVTGLGIFYGHYLPKNVQCFSCGATWVSHEEKMTDVNIAVAMILDAFDDRFDTALLITGDSDLRAPVAEMCKRFPKKRLIVAFPPARESAVLQRAAHAAFMIGRKKLADSQFPEEVEKPGGIKLRRPASWK